MMNTLSPAVPGVIKTMEKADGRSETTGGESGDQWMDALGSS